MKNYYCKNLFLYLTVIFAFTLSNYSYGKQESYSVFAKFPLLGEIEVQEISTDLIITNNKIEYSYNVNPTKVVDFFDDKVSSGFINAELIDNSIHTTEYFFKTEKEDFMRIIKFKYFEGLIKDIIIDPAYDISKITEVTDQMIKESIDPVTMFYMITNYNYIKDCDKIIKVYDGKRRYNLILSNPIESHKSYSCTLTHQKISGYKPEKIKENKKHVSDLKFIMDENQYYKFSEVSLRANNTDLIIRKNN